MRTRGHVRCGCGTTSIGWRYTEDRRSLVKTSEGKSGGDRSAAVEQDHAVRVGGGEVEVVQNDQNGGALPGQ